MEGRGSCFVLRAAVASIVTLAAAHPTAAREIPTGVADLSLRLDTTARYNLGVRVMPVDDRIGANPNFTAGEYSVPQGGLTTNRLDLLVELDLAWNRAGARVSAAGWYDQAYANRSVRRSPDITTPGTYQDNEFSGWVLDRYRGPYGEILDAFAFVGFDVGPVPVTVKAGRHAQTWGEGLLLGGATHGISYAQAPLDLQKAFATPGIEAKELYRPLAALAAQAQLTPSLSLAAQAFFEWQPFLYPEGGTFLGGPDAAFRGPDWIWRPPPPPGGSYVKNGGLSWPRDTGEWGAALRWRSEALDGTAGLYYRRYTDKFAAILVEGSPPAQYRQFYGEGVDLVGVSFSTQALGVSIGADASVRHDTPLLAQSPALTAPPPGQPASLLFPNGIPTLRGNTYQARGDTVHGVLNAVGVAAGLPGMSSASWALEIVYSRWLAVRENEDMFYAVGYGVCRSDPALTAAGLARTTADGCATRDSVGVAAGFTPTWFQAFSGVDLYAPLAFSWTIAGTSPVTFGGNEGSGTYGLGVGADVRSRWRLDLRYAGYFGRASDDGTKVTSVNGLPALLRSRGSVTFTAKATF